jgi:hypothetical protein
LIAEAGGTDLGADLPQASLDAERLLLLSPDVIIIVGGAGHDNAAADIMMEAPNVAAIPAVRNRRVYNAPAGMSGYMATVIETPIYTRWLAEILHPMELVPRTRDLARRIYSIELGITPTEAELDDALDSIANRRVGARRQLGSNPQRAK